MEKRQGDITEVSGHFFKPQIIIHGVNAQGYMGFGVSGAILNVWPVVFTEYRRWLQGPDCPTVGDWQLVQVEPYVWVINAITQKYYRGNVPRAIRNNYVFVDYEAIEKIFREIAETIYYKLDVPKITLNFPSIGSGLANGDWSYVKEIIEFTTNGDFDLVHWEL